MPTEIKDCKQTPMKESERCATCGRPRGLALRREAWSLDCRTALVPRTGNPDDHPSQMVNDLIFNAAVWRNGGTCETTHLCDDCLRIGLRAIKMEVDKLLAETEPDGDKDQQIADLTQRLGIVQHKYNNLAHDHDRMQTRLKAILAILGKARSEISDAKKTSKELLEVALWEVNRGPALTLI